jgi:predicted dinucleotide-utilizing enzyme
MTNFIKHEFAYTKVPQTPDHTKKITPPPPPRRHLLLLALLAPLLAALLLHAMSSSPSSVSSSAPAAKRQKTSSSSSAPGVTPGVIRVGIVGYGSLGAYLSDYIVSPEGRDRGLELAFVWNRSPERVRSSAPAGVRGALLEELSAFGARGRVDVVVEVAHPSITGRYAEAFLAAGADYFCGSPTCFAEQEVETRVRAAAGRAGRAVFLPAGALWGSADIQKMAARGSLKGLTVTMKKAPHHVKAVGALREKLDAIVAAGLAGEQVLYEGPVRGLCPLAPNNVNTMACAAMAAGPALGFDGTRARLVVDKSLSAHVVQVDVEGPGGFTVGSTRFNPAKKGAVTGNATYASFLSSLLAAVDKAGAVSGVHIV